jgi:hypothetical protein
LPRQPKLVDLKASPIASHSEPAGPWPEATKSRIGLEAAAARCCQIVDRVAAELIGKASSEWEWPLATTKDLSWHAALALFVSRVLLRSWDEDFFATMCPASAEASDDPIDPECCPEDFISGMKQHGFDREFAQAQWVCDITSSNELERERLRRQLDPDIRLWADMCRIDQDVFEAQLRLEALGLEEMANDERGRSVVLSDLIESERNILQALRESGHPLKGAELAVKAGYEHNSHFKSTCASLVKREILRSEPGKGYVVTAELLE